MLIRRRRGWEIPERLATPESVVTTLRRGPGRRAMLGAAAAAAILPATAEAQWRLFSSAPDAPARELKPLAAKKDDRYPAGRAITEASASTTYNNYYEFGESKSVADAAQALKVDPWSIEITGMVAKPRKIAFDDLLRQVQLEERVYRHRCVETWAMTVPWTGFPLADLVRLADPKPEATYVVFTTLADEKTMPGLKRSWYPWPYTEGLTVQEAKNDLAFLAIGMYGKQIPSQDGAPIRVAVPWKYGFKSIKSIVKVEFTTKRPTTFWEGLQEAEYGFWANVNPAVPHPRWSQAKERLLGSGDVVPTQIWNGYGEWVAAMYDDKKNERLFA